MTYFLTRTTHFEDWFVCHDQSLQFDSPEEAVAQINAQLEAVTLEGCDELDVYVSENLEAEDLDEGGYSAGVVLSLARDESESEALCTVFMRYDCLTRRFQAASLDINVDVPLTGC